MARQDEALEYARTFVGEDPWAISLGIRVEEVAHERARLSLTPEPRHLNNTGRVHGGAIYALVDQAAAVAANSGEHKAVLAEGKVNFLHAAPSDQDLVAEARPVAVRRKLSLWEVRITSGGELVALGQVLAYHRVRKEG